MKTIITRICTISLCCLLAACVSSSARANEPEFSLPNLESGRIVLPWNELKALLDELDVLKRELNELKPEDDPEAEPPLKYAIVEAHLRGVTEEERVRLTATTTIQVFASGWTIIPFLPAHIGIESVEIALAEDQSEKSGWISWTESNEDTLPPTAQIVRGTDGYDIIARGPATFAVDAVFYAPIQVENLVHTLTLTPPAAVINRLELDIPEKGVKIEQMVPAGRVTQTDEQTSIQTVLNQHDELRLVWKIDKDTGLHRKRTATAHSLVSVEKSALTVSSTVMLNHLTALDQVALLLPADVDILHVTSAMIEGWTTQQSEDAQQSENAQHITLTGEIDRRVPVELTLAYRMTLPELPAQVAIPALAVEGVELFDGFIGVEVLGSLDITPGDTDTNSMIPAKNLPEDLWQASSSPLLHGYEFHANDFSAMLDIKQYQEIQTVVANVDLVECVTHRTLAGKSMSRVRYFVRNNDRQFLTLTLPDNSRIWQAFLDGEPVKPAQKDTGEVLIPMKKSGTQGEELQSFTIEIGYVTEVSKLSLKGDLVSELPGIDVPMSHLRWTLYVPEDYEYTNFEGPLKQVSEFLPGSVNLAGVRASIDIPMQGKPFLFEKFLMIDEIPYVRGKYGQYLGDDIYLAVQPQNLHTLQQVTPMLRK